ncbi:hypothetical protein EBR03_05815 [bacterium]|nr:hypothetical protein [bacterium]
MKFPGFDIALFLQERSKEYKIHENYSHTEYATNCPMCVERGEPTPDHKKKLWINPKTGYYLCYRCSWTGDLVDLIRAFDKCSMGSAMKILQGKPLDPMENLNLHLEIEHYDLDEERQELKEIELPYGYNPIIKNHAYLIERGVPFEYAVDHEWGLSDAGFTKDRLIVPTFMDSKIVFWQARATWEDPDNDDFKKVLNPVGVSARHVLYNYDNAIEFDEVIIVEGFMDACKVGEDAVATNGKNLHPQQVEHLVNAGIKKVVLMWDRDAWEDGSRKKNKLSSIQRATDLLRLWGIQVRAVKMPDEKDPGSYEYHSEELRNLIEQAK